MPDSSGEDLRRRRHLSLNRLFRIPHCIDPSPSGPIPFLKNYTNKEIKRATSGFSTIIKSDPRGIIFKARFSDGYIAAVKQLKASEGCDNFYRDVQLLSHLHHRHLVDLRGFSEGRDRLIFLVFDFMENGSLKDFLHDPLRTPLDWRTRLQIAMGMASAIEYLQFFCDPPVINAYIDSSHVLLDENLVPKLCNFDVLDQDPSSSATSVRNSIIFQFGVLVLELITGQSFESEGTDLIQWIQNCGFAYSMHRMVDADLGSNYDHKELRCLVSVARWCTVSGDKPTSSIRHILRYLQKRIDLQSFSS